MLTNTLCIIVITKMFYLSNDKVNILNYTITQILNKYIYERIKAD